MRRNVLIVETRQEHEARWVDFVRETNPRIDAMLCTWVPENASLN